MCRRCRTRPIIVRKQGTIFLGGPPLVKAATGEVVIGRGSRRRRCARAASRASPTTTRMDDAHALAIARRIVANLNTPQARRPADRRAAASRATTPDELEGLVADGPAASSTTSARSSPASSTARDFDEFKALYGTTLVTGFARIWGMPVGILANNGILFSESALKGAHFIELCCQRRIPLLFLQNISGFMVGRAVRGRRHRQGRRQAGHRGGLRQGAEDHA